MKTTMQAVAVAVLGVALAAPAWGHSSYAYSEQIPGSVSVAMNGHIVTVGWSNDTARAAVALRTGTCSFNAYVGDVLRFPRTNRVVDDADWAFHSGGFGIFDWPQSITLPDRWHGRKGDVYAHIYCGHFGFVGHAHGRLDGAPPEPETPTPPPSEPDPDPEAPEPGHTHPVQRCDHLAIAGDEDAPDHWLRITNPGAASIHFTIEGRDEAGAKGGTYRRELPAYRSVRVMMRDIEAAFDVTDPEGWWWLKVSGSGPIDVAATMKQGEARRFVTVKVPATCGTGPVTRTGE